MYLKTTASIVAGNSQSNAINLNQLTPVGFITTGSTTTGSLLSFLVSSDGSNFYPLYDAASAEVTFVVSSASRAYAMDQYDFFGWNYLKLREGASASSINQATYPATFDVILKSF